MVNNEFRPTPHCVERGEKGAKIGHFGGLGWVVGKGEKKGGKTGVLGVGGGGVWETPKSA